jgi:hypothetical protein
MMNRFALTLVLPLLSSLAFAQTYAQRSAGVRAGVLLIESQRQAGVPANFTPHVFYNLDLNHSVKPAGWNIYNPRGATRATPEIIQRWLLLSSAVGGGAPAQNEVITKRGAAYWEVNLSSATEALLGEYDILLLSGYGSVALNPLERERLRRFIDQGGILWVDLTANSPANNIDVINNLPLPITRGTNNIFAGRGFDRFHPLLSNPYGINNSGLFAMETDNLNAIRPINLQDHGAADLRRILAPIEPDSLRLNTIAFDRQGPTISLGKIGDGWMVVTARGVAHALNRSIVNQSYNDNRQYMALPPSFDRASAEAAKLVVNMIHLVSNHDQYAGGSRKQNSSPVDLNAPLLNLFSAQNTVPALSGLQIDTNIRNYNPPAVFKGLVVMSSSNRIYVFDADPKTDLDGDGDADDGIRDYTDGAKYDLVWVSAPMNGPISPPVGVEVQNPGNGIPRDQILVTDSRGVLHSFDAFPTDAQGRIIGTQNAGPAFSVSPPTPADIDPGEDGRGPYSPTVHESVAYMVDTVAGAGFGARPGRVWLADLQTGDAVRSGSTPWSVGGGGIGGGAALIAAAGSPTVGYIPIQDGSGGQDKVVYVPSRPTGVPGPNGAAAISSFWVGARGEKPNSIQVVGGNLVVTTRASLQGLNVFAPNGSHPLGLKLSVINSAGDVLPASGMNALFTGQVSQAGGILTFPMRPAATFPANASVRLDYHIDWGTNTPGVSSQILRGNLFLADENQAQRRILHNLALSPQGTLFAVHGNQTSGGALYALREEGRGTFRLLYRYELYPEHTFNLNQAGPTTYAETLGDVDPVTTLPGPPSAFLGGRLFNLTFMGGPTVSNGVVYATARAVKNGVVPVSILMAFSAEPQPVSIPVGDVREPFSLVQPDIGKSGDKARPTVWSTLQQNTQFTYEREGPELGTIRIDNLMGTTRGAMVNAFSTSQPVILRSAGRPDVLIEPDRIGGRWNPLLWYAIGHGVANSSPALVTGNTAFIAGASVLPNILTGSPLFPAKGMLTAIDVGVNPNDPFLRSVPQRPWLRQLVQLTVNGGDIRPNPAIRWPQFTGITNFDEYRVRLLQTLLGPSQNAFGVVGGNGGLFAWSERGLWGYTRADFLVADEGRLARFDPAGSPIWVSNATLQGGEAVATGATGNVRGLVRPTRAYRLNQNEMLVVDSGADRVVRIDKSGREQRSISQIRLDATFRPEGFQGNDPLTLRQPKDVVMYTSVQQTPSLSGATGQEFWIHYLIADSGNRRLVELVDRYRWNPTTRSVEEVVEDANGVAQLGVLLWQTPPNVSGKNFDYNSVDRIWVNGRYVYAAGIGSTMPTRVDMGLDSPTGASTREAQGGNSGIVVFDANDTIVINEVVVPAIGNNVLWDERTNTFQPGRAAFTKSINNLTSVTLGNIVEGNQTRMAVMFTDASGVFEVYSPDGTGNSWQVRWMLPRSAYGYMRRKTLQRLEGGGNASFTVDFKPTYARRLENGDVMVVNGASGPWRRYIPTGNPDRFDLAFARRPSGVVAFGDNPTGRYDFYGDVLQVDGNIFALDGDNGIAGTAFGFDRANFGFLPFSIRFELPPIQGVRGIMLPVFADRR